MKICEGSLTAMKYIERNLLSNEKLVYGIRPHWVIFSSTVWTAVIAIYLWLFEPVTIPIRVYANISMKQAIVYGLLAASAYLLLTAYIFYANSEYGVTNKRVLVKIGWIKRKSLELMLDKVEAVLVNQGIIGRIFNYGSITIIGTGGTSDTFPFIPDPLLFRRIVQEQISAIDDARHSTPPIRNENDQIPKT